MPTQQYIGARYVPIIFGDWEAGRTYEPLSVVTYNGASFTSKRAVPAGTVPTNTNYWAITGNYNAQVESYRQQMLNDLNHLREQIAEANEEYNTEASEARSVGDLVWLNGDLYKVTAAIAEGAAYVVGTNITAWTIEDSIAAVNSALNSKFPVQTADIADSAVTYAKIRDHAVSKSKIALKRIIFIGDSYNRPEYGDIVARIVANLHLDYYWDATVSGHSFHDGSYLIDLQGVVNGLTDLEKELVTDIVVIGGINDSFNNLTEDAIRTAINAFCEYADTNLPNALISVNFCGNAKSGEPNRGLQDYLGRKTAINAYQHINKPNYTFIEGHQYIMHNYYYMRDDGIHPNIAGGLRIAEAICYYLLGSGIIQYTDIDTHGSIVKNDTNVTALLGGSVIASIEGNCTQLNIQKSVLNFAASHTIAANDAVTIELGDLNINTLYGNSDYLSIPTMITIKNADDSITLTQANILIKHGKISIKIWNLGTSSLTIAQQIRIPELSASFDTFQM